MRRDGDISLRELRDRTPLLALIGEDVKLKRAGREHVGLCPFHAEKSGSFYVNGEKGLWVCYGCGRGGSAIEYLRERYGLDVSGAARLLKARLGVIDRGDVPPLAPRTPLPQQRADEEERKLSALEWCVRVWAACMPADGTIAAEYLLGRGIDPDVFGGMPYDLRFHPGLWHAESKTQLPAMVGRVADAEGKLCGLHRTYLAHAGADVHSAAAAAARALRPERSADRVVVKAPVKPAKKMAGVTKGGCVQLAPAARKLAIAEGIETALSVMQEQGIPAWAALSLGNLGGITLPPEVHEVVLCADNDAKDKDAAEKLLQAAARAYEAQGVAVWIARPPEGMDFNDLLVQGLINNQGGTDAISQG